MWQKENQDISMIASEHYQIHYHLTIKYQVYLYDEEVKDNRMIILKNRKYWFGKWNRIGKARLLFLIKRRTKHFYKSYVSYNLISHLIQKLKYLSNDEMQFIPLKTEEDTWNRLYNRINEIQ